MQELKPLSHDPTGHVDQASDMSQSSMRQELHESEHREIACASTLPLPQPWRRSIRVKEQYRIRRLGGGRKLLEEHNPTLVAALEQVLSNENEIAGDPMSEHKWVRSTPKRRSEKGSEQNDVKMSAKTEFIGV